MQPSHHSSPWLFSSYKTEIHTHRVWILYGDPNTRYSQPLSGRLRPPHRQASLAPHTGRLCLVGFPLAELRFCWRFPPASGAGSESLEEHREGPVNTTRGVEGCSSEDTLVLTSARPWGHEHCSNVAPILPPEKTLPKKTRPELLGLWAVTFSQYSGYEWCSYFPGQTSNDGEERG